MLNPQDLKNFRTKFRLSQNDFGKIFGLTAKAVSNIEIGFRRPSKTILQMMMLLDSIPEKQSSLLIKKLTAHSSAQATFGADR